MRVTINSVPDSSQERLLIAGKGDIDTFYVTEHCDDGSVETWVISRADLHAAPKLKWPEPIPLVTVPSTGAVDGHWWMSNGTFRQFLEL